MLPTENEFSKYLKNLNIKETDTVIMYFFD